MAAKSFRRSYGTSQNTSTAAAALQRITSGSAAAIIVRMTRDHTRRRASRRGA